MVCLRRCRRRQTLALRDHHDQTLSTAAERSGSCCAEAEACSLARALAPRLLALLSLSLSLSASQLACLCCWQPLPEYFASTSFQRVDLQWQRGDSCWRLKVSTFHTPPEQQLCWLIGANKSGTMTIRAFAWSGLSCAELDNWSPEWCNHHQKTKIQMRKPEEQK